ncbi:hypothetical protein [Nodosilinea nodulosa]|uniref:hypothetical protein n=1 Tax=Nodosilinea nodulosa TaxID=416001 RepID=UPI0012D776B6|nr:hypothetical protein [Nodosilinea nodulosa]
MKLAKSIDRDYRSLRNYFHKKFELMEIALTEDEAAPTVAEDADADKSQAAYHGFSHLIKPDMLMNTYSYWEFWAKNLCDYQKYKRDLPQICRRTKGKSALQVFHEYLTGYVGIDLSAVQDSRDRIDDLRRVRNKFMHNGGYISDKEEDEYCLIEGISINIFPYKKEGLMSSLITIEYAFIWSTLDHAKVYLYTAAIA